MKKNSEKHRDFESIGDIIVSICDLLSPAERLTPAECAAKYRKVNQPGAYVGDWLNETTPMMVEPMNEFDSREFEGVVYVGPAQSGKTDALVLNTLVYAAKVQPMDMMIVCPTNTAGRDFSIRRIDRLNRHTPVMSDLLLRGRDYDNKFDKQYRNGMLVSISWPTPTELAGKPIGRIVMTDFDRMPMDVAGDGNPYDLASKRTTTFGSYAMCLAESSPSKEVLDLKWIAKSPHEAPPTEGILALYNRGDRRRWYWPCPMCWEYFEGNFKHLVYERDPNQPGQTNMEIAESTKLQCPHCAYKIHADERKYMQSRGRWVKDGQYVDIDGNVIGPRMRTRIASFWQNGVSAAFISWKKLVTLYLDAKDDYDRTGSEESLQKFYNNDLGEPYYPQSQNELRVPEVLKSRAEKVLDENVKKVPEGVRFLIGTADVQKNSFVCQVFGILPGRPYDTVLVDRFVIFKSQRLDHDDERLWIKPHAYLEDWDELIPHLIEKEYELADGSGRMMAIRYTGCDSGGKEGVTTMAYNFYRKLRQEGKAQRFMLLRGDHLPNQPRTRIGHPDTNRRDNKSGARGDIPVLFLNSNMLKDDLNGRLDCILPGKGMYRFGNWLEDRFFAELCAEIRTEKGWINPSNARNEAWDLSYYCLGICNSEIIKAEVLDWDNAPGWAATWDKNDLIREPEKEPIFTLHSKSKYDFSQLGKALA